MSDLRRGLNLDSDAEASSSEDEFVKVPLDTEVFDFTDDVEIDEALVAAKARQSLARLLADEQQSRSTRIPVSDRIAEKVQEGVETPFLDHADVQDVSRRVVPEAKAPEIEYDAVNTESFDSLNLSRSVVRGLKAMGITNPTPVQSKCIPIALTGRDLLVNAVTGSGKTLAFLCPVLERLIMLGGKHRRRLQGSPRVVILCPTRELAVQCADVALQLSEALSNPPLQIALVVGGLSEQAQATALRNGPDIAICSPGRLLDHILNTHGVSMDGVDVVVMDEADRLLEMGFIEEIREIIMRCPRSRQTLMFSATMSNQVKDLADYTLDKPDKVEVDPISSLNNGLTQEFVRIRGQYESEETRCGVVLALCLRNFHTKTIVFFPSKLLAHRMRIMFGLCGLKCGELHGNLTQGQRLQALAEFREGKIDILLATDIASRGLDVKGVETVINYSLPKDIASYVHRVGRTARAGLKGHAVTLVGDGKQKMVADIVKRAPHQIMKRSLPTEVMEEAVRRVESMRQLVEEILSEEKTERGLEKAEMEAKRGENMVIHHDEIMARPAKVWFQNEKEKQELKDRTKEKALGQEALLASMTPKQKKMFEKKQLALEERRKDFEAQSRDKASTMAKVKAATQAHKVVDNLEIAEEVEPKVYTKKSRIKFMDTIEDGNSFDKRYAGVTAEEKAAEESKDTKKRVGKAHNAFKSKKRYKRR